MRFRDLSQAAIEHSWDRWKCLIRDMLHEFNDDVFSGGGSVCENHCQEPPYLLLETDTGCLYIFPLPGNEIALRILKHKFERVTLALMASQSRAGQENFVGGFRLKLSTMENRRYSVKKEIQNEIEKSLRLIYVEYWIDLIY
jgi:hypothetical protein